MEGDGGDDDNNNNNNNTTPIDEGGDDTAPEESEIEGMSELVHVENEVAEASAVSQESKTQNEEFDIIVNNQHLDDETSTPKEMSDSRHFEPDNQLDDANDDDDNPNEQSTAIPSPSAPPPTIPISSGRSTTTDPIISSSFSPRIDAINTLLKNMFHTPTKNLETAFATILQMLKDQATDHATLKNAHDELTKRYREDKAAHELTAARHVTVMEEQAAQQRVLAESHEGLRRGYEESLEVIEGLKEKIKVMAYNLNGFDPEEEDHGNEGDEHVPSMIDNHELPSLTSPRSQITVEIEGEEPTPPLNGGSDEKTNAEENAMPDDVPVEASPPLDSSEVDKGPHENEQNKDDGSNHNDSDENEQLDSDLADTISVKSSPDKIPAVDNIPQNNESKPLSPQPTTPRSNSSRPSSNNDDASAASSSSAEDDEETELRDRADASLPSFNTPPVNALATAVSLYEGARRNSRRASINVTKQKFDAQMTLGVRLDRLEESQRNLQQELLEAKRMKELYGRQKKICKRLGIVEEFLLGFGIIEENKQKEEGEEGATATNVVENGETLEPKDFDKDSIDSVATVSDNTANGVDSITAESTNNESVVENEAVAGSHESNAREDVSVEDMKRIGDNENDNGSYQSQMNDQSTVDSSTTKLDGDDNKRKILLSSVVSPLKGSNTVGLISHMKAQEHRMDNLINNLSQQLNELNEKMTSRISRKSVQNYFSQLDVDALKNVPPLPGIDDAELRSLRDHIETVESRINNDMVSKHQLTAIFRLSLSSSSPEGRIDDDDVVTDADASLLTFKETVETHLAKLQRTKLEMSDLSAEMENVSSKMTEFTDDLISQHQSDTLSSLQKLQDDINEIRSYIELVEGRLQQFSDEENDPQLPHISESEIEDRIKLATDQVQASLEETLNARMEEIHTLENEVARCSNQLAERPDQDQINGMLQELEDALQQRLGGTGQTVRIILNNMKSELKQKVTRDEVMNAVGRMIGDAKQGVQNNRETLMIGRVPYRCLGCNQAYPGGVNGRMARKVNHRALPSSSGGLHAYRLSSSSHLRVNGGFGKGGGGGGGSALKPLQLSHGGSSAAAVAVRRRHRGFGGGGGSGGGRRMDPDSVTLVQQKYSRQIKSK